MLEAEVTKSNITAALVGEAGTNAKFLGWSTGTLDFDKCSFHRLNAYSPPTPFVVIVSPTKVFDECGSDGEAIRNSSLPTF